MTRRIRITVVPREPFDLDRFVDALLELARTLEAQETPPETNDSKAHNDGEGERHD